ncbi:MAG: glycosyltransferase [Pseudomonadota bacterium]
MDSQHILFFGEDWGRHPSTAQHLARELCRTHRITWVNSIGLREPKLGMADLGRVVGKVTRALRPKPESGRELAATSPVADALQPACLVSPWILPWHRSRSVRALNRLLLRRPLRAQVEPDSAVLVSANPASYYLHDLVRPRATVYYCADKYAQIAGLNPRLVERFEREMLDRADLVVATSRALVDDLSRSHANVAYLPHGVDVGLFATTLELPRSVAAPCIGFVGLLGEHIDLNLLSALADAMDDGRILCAGPIEAGVVAPRHPRIEYLGPLPQVELPAMLAETDICILPYTESERNHYANPTKVREYLAAGRAVVATDQPGIADIDGDVRIGRTGAEFVSLALAALAEARMKEPSKAVDIGASMQAHGWDARADAFSKLLEQICD